LNLQIAQITADFHTLASDGRIASRARHLPFLTLVLSAEICVICGYVIFSRSKQFPQIGLVSQKLGIFQGLLKWWVALTRSGRSENYRAIISDLATVPPWDMDEEE
jgi:hypothetical protein